MPPIILENKTLSGQRLQATFLPNKGMNLTSFKKDEIEFIDQSTQLLFDERYAGLGALIGPHFHRKRKEIVPPVKDETKFPHIERIKAKGIHDPFSHGIGRYAPWKAEADRMSLKAVLTGKDTWNDHLLSDLEGQNFKMELEAQLQQNGLFLSISIVSDTDSLVGLHYYYYLPNGNNRVKASVRPQMRDQKGELLDIPSPWLTSAGELEFDLSQEADFTFRPPPGSIQTTILLETDSYSLKTHYSCACEENAWQLYHPAGASFACIEPLSSQDPRHPNLSVSSLRIHLEPIG